MNDALPTVDRLLLLGRSTYAPQRSLMLRELREDCFKIPCFRFLSEFIPTLRTLANDIEPIVRTDLYSCLPHIAGYLIQDDPESGYALVFDGAIFHLLTPAFTNEDRQIVKPALISSFIGISAHMTISDRLERILAFLIPSCDPSAPEELRVNCCLLIEALPALFTPQQSFIYLVPQLCALTEDPAARVREALIPGFIAIAALNPPLEISRKIAQFFYKLGKDFQWTVRVAAVSKFSEISRLLKDPAAVPAMLHAVVDPSIWVSRVALRHCGNWLGILPDPPAALRQDFFEFLQCVKEGVDAEDRPVAEGLGAAARILGAPKIIFQASLIFAKSSDEPSRTAVACNFSEISKILETQEIITLLNIFLDDSTNVSKAAILGIPGILKSSGDRELILFVLIEKLQASGECWRKRLAAAQIFLEISETFQESMKLAKFWISLLADPVHAVRASAAENAHGIIKNLFPHKTASFVNHFVLFFGRSESSARRQTFLRVAANFDFENYPVFERCAAALATDPVIGISMTWAAYLGPKIAKINSGRIKAAARKLKIACAGKMEILKYLSDVPEGDSLEETETDEDIQVGELTFIFETSETAHSEKRKTPVVEDEEVGEALKINFT